MSARSKRSRMFLYLPLCAGIAVVAGTIPVITNYDVVAYSLSPVAIAEITQLKESETKEQEFLQEISRAAAIERKYVRDAEEDFRKAVEVAIAVQAEEAERQAELQRQRRAAAERRAAAQAASAPPPRAEAHTAPSGGVWEHLARIRQCESGGNYGAVNPSGKYRGAYQFARQTWDGTARSAGRGDLVGVDPAAASPADQDAMAYHLYTTVGPGQWPQCQYR